MNWIDFFNDLTVVTSNKICQNGGFFTMDKKIYKKAFNDINKKMRFAKDDIVLDIGCGNGEITKFILPLVKRVILADGASKMLEIAGQTTKDFKNTEFKLIDLNKLFNLSQFGTFNKILCYSVIHYLDDYQRLENLLKQMINALKPGGIILVGDIPLADKREEYLSKRKKKLLLNFFADVKYFFKKKMTGFIIKNINNQVDRRNSISFTRDKITRLINNLKIKNITFSLVEQDNISSFSNSREDLLIIKK